MTGDLFNLYVFFEIFLITSFVMAIYRGHSSQLLGGYKYLILNLVASSGFIIALGCIYNSLGTLNVAHIARLIASGEANLITEVGLVFLVTTFAAKSGLVPLYYWLPASYPSLPTPILALFAGLLTKIGVYTLLRCYSLFLPNYVWLQETILIISLLTMSIGVIGAAVQMNIRKILSFHIISQIGYITIGIGLSSFVGYLATIVYLIHHMVVKTNLFLVAGMIQKLKGTNELVNLGSLKKNYPILALLFMIPALSLAGVPPLSGFWAKWMVIQSLTVSNHWISLIVAMLVSAFTLFSMMKIWLEAFWKTENLSLEKTGLETKIQTNKSDFFVMAIPVFILCIWTLAFGFGIESVIKLSKQAATQLAAPQNYITAVLGEQGGVE